MISALLLIAHGSRQAEANQDLHDVVQSLRAQGRYSIVEPAFLELAEPSIEEAGDDDRFNADYRQAGKVDKDKAEAFRR